MDRNWVLGHVLGKTENHVTCSLEGRLVDLPISLFLEKTYYGSKVRLSVDGQNTAKIEILPESNLETKESLRAKELRIPDANRK